jgi:hypothetical protein
MFLLKVAGTLGAAMALGLSALIADAQAPPPAPAEAPPADAAPGPQTFPPEPKKRRAAPRSESPAGHEMLGLSVYSSDGSRVGDVHDVKMGPNGDVAALHVRSGGFLGFGARIVAIPEGKFAHNGQSVRLVYTAEEVGRLPQVGGGR